MRAVYVAYDPKLAGDEVSGGVDEGVGGNIPDIPLDIMHTRYRAFQREFLAYLESVQDQGRSFVTVVIPELVPRLFWEHVLHPQTKLMLKLALWRKNVAVASVPHQMRR
ncbi:MAG: hypothetical protein HY261_04680 [Chloroflexi bacterium]|nr:hypothetical protein [Chloroflexota bacterium]